MPTIQIWATDYDLETLRKLKEYLEEEQEAEFKGKAWLMSEPTYYSRGKRRRKRIKRQNINYSLIYRNALNCYYLEIEEQMSKKRHSIGDEDYEDDDYEEEDYEEE